MSAAGEPIFPSIRDRIRRVDIRMNAESVLAAGMLERGLRLEDAVGMEITPPGVRRLAEVTVVMRNGDRHSFSIQDDGQPIAFWDLPPL